MYFQILIVFQFICEIAPSPAPFSFRPPSLNVDFKEILSKRELCPELTPSQLESHFYHAETHKCYKLGIPGPCKKHMIFMPYDADNVNGICVCNNAGSTRFLAYHEETKSCHLVFTQGYCQSPSEWLVPESKRNEDHLTCKPNPCYRFSAKDLRREYVPYRSRCIPLGQPNSSCEKDQIIGFEFDNLYPKCINKYAAYALGNLNRRCSSGLVRSHSGKCIKATSITW